MNTTRKVITSFVTIEDAKLYLRGQTALTKLTGNAKFPGTGIDGLPPLTQPPAPAPPVVNLTDANSAFLTALIAADNGDPLTTATKNNARDVVVGILNKWGDYVNLVAKGVLTDLYTSGFMLNKLRGKIGILPKPDAPIVTSPGVGQLKATVKAKSVEDATSLLWEVQPVDANDAPVGNPDMVGTTSTELYLISKPSGSRFRIRVVGVGTDNSVQNWSDPVIGMVI